MSSFAVQAEPVIRVMMPGHCATKRHREKVGSSVSLVFSLHSQDADYGHVPEEINFWLPITSVSGSNSLWVESFPGRGDFAALEGSNGHAFRWWGNLCEHYAEPNGTGCTRVSLDFRLIPGRFWAAAVASGGLHEAETKRKHHHGGSMFIGSYYTWIRTEMKQDSAVSTV
eukprot:g27409.t2